MVGLPHEGSGRRRPRRRRLRSLEEVHRRRPLQSLARVRLHLRRQDLRHPEPRRLLGRLLQQEGLHRAGRSTPPTTWEELEATAAALKGKDVTPVRRDDPGTLAGLHLVRGVPRPPEPGLLRPADERRGQVHRSGSQGGVRQVEGMDRRRLLHRSVDRLRHGRHQRHGRASSPRASSR